MQSLIELNEETFKVVKAWYESHDATPPPAGDLLMLSAEEGRSTGFLSVQTQGSVVVANGLIGTRDACRYLLALLEEYAVAARKRVLLTTACPPAKEEAREAGYVQLGHLSWAKDPSADAFVVEESPDEEDDLEGDGYEDLGDDGYEDEEDDLDEEPEPEPAPRPRRNTIAPKRGKKGKRNGRNKPKNR